MPIYVYECAKCAKVFEHEQRIVESALTECLCGQGGSVKRLIQPSAVMFKGSGFHINDYAPSTTTSSSDSSSSPAPSESTPSESAK